MTAEEAYRKGQQDMRARIVKQWGGWITHTIGGYHRANRPGRKSVSNVGMLIRHGCKVQPLTVTERQQS